MFLSCFRILEVNFVSGYYFFITWLKQIFRNKKKEKQMDRHLMLILTASDILSPFNVTIHFIVLGVVALQAKTGSFQFHLALEKTLPVDYFHNNNLENIYKVQNLVHREYSK